MWKHLDRELTCIVWLGVSFMFLMGSNTTLLNMQMTIVSSIAYEKEDFHVDGYTLTAITFLVYSICVCYGPYVTHALGAKSAMVISAVGFMFYSGSYIIEEVWALYGGAVISGMAQGSLWPAHGHYMIQNSTPKTTSRNINIFYTLMKMSAIFANTVMYFTFHGKKYIDEQTRMAAIYFLFVSSLASVIAFATLPTSVGNNLPKEYDPVKTIKRTWRVIKTRRMLWLTVFFAFAGIHLSFRIGIYSPSLGFTLAFGDSAKELVALSGIFIGIGGLMGCTWPLLLPDRLRNHHLTPRLIVLASGVAAMFAYFITFIMIPDDAVFGDTEELSFIRPRASLAMINSLILSFCETSFTTQIYCVIGWHYRDSTAEATGLYKFISALLVSVSFFYGNNFGLHTQLAILAVMGVLGVFAFIIADLDNSPDDKVKLLSKKSHQPELSSSNSL